MSHTVLLCELNFPYDILITLKALYTYIFILVYVLIFLVITEVLFFFS